MESCIIYRQMSQSPCCYLPAVLLKCTVLSSDSNLRTNYTFHWRISKPIHTCTHTHSHKHFLSLLFSFLPILLIVYKSAPWSLSWKNPFANVRFHVAWLIFSYDDIYTSLQFNLHNYCYHNVLSLDFNLQSSTSSSSSSMYYFSPMFFSSFFLFWFTLLIQALFALK